MLRLLLALSLGATMIALSMATPTILGGTRRMSLVGRQLAPGPIPAPCQADCNTTIPILNSNLCTPAECCTSSFDMGFFNCAKCLGQLDNSTDYTTIQMTLDTLHNQCASVGISIPKLTFPGQNPNRQLSSVASRPSSSSSGAPGATVSNSSHTTVALPTIMQTTITAITPSLMPTIGPQSTITSLPSAPVPNTPSSAGTINTLARVQSWTIAIVAGIPLLFYLGV